MYSEAQLQNDEVVSDFWCPLYSRHIWLVSFCRLLWALYSYRPIRTLLVSYNSLRPVEGMAKETESKLGTGGMQTKIKAAKLAIEKNIEVVIASGESMKTIRDIVKGEEIGTYFKC